MRDQRRLILTEDDTKNDMTIIKGKDATLAGRKV